MKATLIAMARRAQSRAPMEIVHSAEISTVFGMAGDSKGLKFPNRQITVLAVEDWQAALHDLGDPDLTWTTRRANFLIEGMSLPRGKGSVLTIGEVVLEVTDQTTPCSLMDKSFPGLRLALAPDWRGGVTCKVLQGGFLTIGAEVSLTKHLIDKRPQLPG